MAIGPISNGIKMNKKIYKIIFGLLILMLVVFIFQSTLNGKKIVLAGACPVSMAGDGTSEDPCVITSCTELQAMNQALDHYYILDDNIDCSATSGWNGGLGFEPIATFSGSFDGQNGQGFTITDLFIDRPSSSYVALFGKTSSGSVVSDVGLVDVNITGLDFTGGLIGDSLGSVSNSSSTGSVTGLNNFYAGGLLARVFSGVINNSYSSGSVSGNKDVGGLIGAITFGSINNSYSTANVTGAGNKVGGLIGNNFGGTVSNAYSMGFVSGGGVNVGGLIGIISGSGTCTDSFWDTETSGQSTSACSAEGKTSVEMTTQSTFTSAGWDFTVIPIWKIISSSGFLSYPCLEWQADSTCTLSIITAPPSGNFLMGMPF